MPPRWGRRWASGGSASWWPALPLLLCLLVLLAGCERQPPGAAALRVGLAQAPLTLDPRYATDAVSYRLCRLLYASLVDFDDGARPVPALADWEAVGPRRYRFRLRAGGRAFTDGSRLEAADVKATYDSVLAPGSASAYRGTLSMVEAIEVVDADTLDFVLERPDPDFPGRLLLGILPAAAIAAGHAFERSPLGSGPFALEAWPDASRISLLRRRDGLPVHFLTLRDPLVRALKLARGEIDLLQGDLPAELSRWLAGRSGLRVLPIEGDTFSYLGFNFTDPVLAEPRVREAFALAIDREAIVRHVLGEGARPAASVLAPDHWAGHPALRPPPYDPARARALLGQLGYGPGRPLRLSYKTSNNAQRVRLATILQAQLAEVGIALDIQSLDWGTYYADVKAGRFQVYTLAWVGVKLPDIFRYAFHSDSLPPEGANRGRYRDADADALIEGAEYMPSRAERAAAYRQLQSRLVEQLPYVPLWYESSVLAVRDDIRGFVPSADGNLDALAVTVRGP